MSSKRPMKGEINDAPAFAANNAWFAEKQRVTFTMCPSDDSVLHAFNPSHVRGTLTAMLGAISTNLRPSAIMVSASVDVTSALTGPDTIAQISFVTSMMSRPDFLIRDGLVVTPSTMPKSFNSRI